MITQPCFVAYDAANCEYEWFATFPQAVAWLKEANDEGISDETMEGLSFIARITHRTGFVETDNRKNYREHTDGRPVDCDEEEWPYDEWDYVGKVVFVPVIPPSITESESEGQP